MTTLTKDIRYDRETQDFALYLDGGFVGYARTRREAEERLDALVYDRLTKGVQASAELTNELAIADATVRVEAATERGDKAALAVAVSDLVDAIADGLPGGRAALEANPLPDNEDDDRHHCARCGRAMLTFTFSTSRICIGCEEEAQAPLVTLTVATLTDAICEALDTAREKAAGNLRWMVALDSAANWLLQQEELAWDGEAHALHVPSASTPGIVYIANGACQCEAFSKHNACWHRAAARLVKRAIDLVVDTDVQALADEIALEAPEYADHAGEMQAEALLYALAWDAVADALKGERALFA